MQLSDEELDAVVALIDSLRDFTKYGREMHRQHVKTLLLVAREEGKSVGEYAVLAGVSLAHMSRDLLELGEHRNGFGLVATRRGPTDLRKKEVVLTPEGRELADRMVGYWRNEPEIVSEYQERMARDEEEKKKVIELRNRSRTLKPGSTEWTETFKGNSKPEHIAGCFSHVLHHLMHAFAVKGDYSTNLIEAREAWQYMWTLVEGCKEPLNWYEVFNKAVKTLRDAGDPERRDEHRDLDEAYREVARTGMLFYVDHMREEGFGSVKHRRFMDALRHLEELRDQNRKERERERASSVQAITWKRQSEHGDEISVDIAPGSCLVFIGGKVFKRKGRRSHGYSMAAELSKEDAISLAELLLTKYTGHKEGLLRNIDAQGGLAGPSVPPKGDEAV
jgi:DNA-binding MarR family transcriptional regulator